MISQRIQTVIEELEEINAEAISYGSDTLQKEVGNALQELYWAWKTALEASV